MVTIQKNNKCGQYSRGATDKKRATKRYSEKNRDIEKQRGIHRIREGEGGKKR